ncbi:hypothetical protein TNCV_4270551 [Trichonephila clavipes]|nr:hypothetical protein TNCV_4270551 [Trichonephila clavipes]
MRLLFIWIGSLKVSSPLREPKVEGSIPAGVWHTKIVVKPRRMTMWHVKDPLSINLALVLLTRLNQGIQASQRDFILGIRQFVIVAIGPTPSATLFLFPGWFSEGIASCNCPPQSFSDMLYRVEVWRSGWSIHTPNILTFYNFVDQKSLCSRASSSIKMNSGPHATLKKRT